MAILSKGQTFASGDSVTSTKLNNLVDSATFVSGSSGTTDDSSLEVNSGGRLQVKESGITSAKLGSSSVTTPKIANSTSASDGVTYEKLQRVNSMTVIGNTTGALAVASEVSVLDQDDMSSNSATSLATQQSIKAYVDTKVAASFILGTSQNTTSGTSIDFIGIPSGTKRITIMFNGISTSGSSLPIVQLGDSGGIETTGYSCAGQDVAVLNATSTTGFLVASSWSSAQIGYGQMTLNLMDSTNNRWTMAATLGSPATSKIHISAGFKATSDTLTRVRLTTTNGTDTFDLGSVNISYE